MGIKATVLLICLGLVLPVFALAKPMPMAVKTKIINALVRETQQAEMFAEQFNKLRKQYPSYEQQITNIEKVHADLLQATEKSLTLAYHYVYYMRHMIPTLEKMYNSVEKIDNPAAKKACIELLNHSYKYSTARDNPSTYLYRANLKYIAKMAIEEESRYQEKEYKPVWAEFYNQFDCEVK